MANIQPKDPVTLGLTSQRELDAAIAKAAKAAGTPAYVDTTLDSDRLALIEVAFPKFRDGRGYSSARILREAGYTGELRAQGDVLVDQIPLMKRCGFDSFAPEAPQNQAHVDAALARFDHVYQGAADAAVPVWKLRHG